MTLDGSREKGKGKDYFGYKYSGPVVTRTNRAKVGDAGGKEKDVLFLAVI